MIKINIRLFLTVILCSSMLFVLNSSKVYAAESIKSLQSEITINQDASVHIVETIRYTTTQEKHGIFRDIPVRYDAGKNDGSYYDIGFRLNKVVDENGTPYQYSMSRSGGEKRVKIGDPNRTFSGDKTYVIDYSYLFAINYFADHDELYLNVSDDQWDFPLALTEATVNFNGFSPTKLNYKCFSGPVGSTDEDCQKEFKDNKIYFSSLEPLTIVVGFEPGLIAKLERPLKTPFHWPRWESGWFFLIPLLVFGLLFYHYLRRGRDPAGRGTIAPEFAPPEKMKPAEIGGLMDERIDPRDISASIIDFAVRGYLKIKKIAPKDYELKKNKNLSKEAIDFEKKLFKAIFGSANTVLLSELKGRFFSEVPQIKEALYSDLVDKKYFEKNPDQVRKKYYLIGGLIVAFSFFSFIISASLAFSIMISGILVFIFARFMPKKTREGVIAHEKCLGFKEFIYRADRYRVKWQEKEHIFEDYLAYAMVFGIAKQWAKHFKDIYKEPPKWYSGEDWTTFSTIYFVSSLSHFNSTAVSSFNPVSAATSASSGSSGFSSGGGFSGGGFGGGGGGSW